MLRHSSLALILAILISLVTACSPSAAPAQPTAVSSSGSPAATQPPAPASPTEAAPAATQSGEQPTTPAENPPASDASFVLFDREASMLHVYNLDGTQRYEAPTPGLQYPTENTLSIVKNAVYYATDGMDKSIFRASAQGTQDLGLNIGRMSSFKVSPDEKWVAWGVLNMESTPPSSTLWIKDLTSGAKDAKQIATFTRDPAKAFSLMPIQFSEDGSRLYFERALVGLGGYILYSGHFSLYSYDLTSGQISTIIPAEENRFYCMDTFRLDLSKVTYLCTIDPSNNQPTNQISVRDLTSGQETPIPLLPDQRVGGNTRFSPNGQWLAYAAARGNPEDEAGQVAVVPADLSAAPTVIYKVAQKRYPQVQGWLDDDTLLITIVNFEGPRNTVMTIRRDGTDAREIASGEFIGWIK